MYKRTKKSLINNPPTRGGVIVKAQFGCAKYSDIAFAIPTRIDASGTYYLIEDMNDNITTEVVGSLNEGKLANMHEQSRRVYGTEGVAPTIHTCGGGNLDPKVLVCAMRGRGDDNQQTLEVKQEECTNAITTVQKDNLVIVIERNYVKEMELINGTADGLASTLTTGHDNAKHITEPKGGHKQMGVKETIIYETKEDDDYSDLFQSEININIKFPRRYRIRKLTERECFRLMGLEDADIDKIRDANISKTQQYKMAGNSIVVDVLYHIFRKMFVETKADGGVQLEMF